MNKVYHLSYIHLLGDFHLLTCLASHFPSPLVLCSVHALLFVQFPTDGHRDFPVLKAAAVKILVKHACLHEGMFHWVRYKSIKGVWYFHTTLDPCQTNCLPIYTRSVWEYLFQLNEIIELLLWTLLIFLMGFVNILTDW